MALRRGRSVDPETAEGPEGEYVTETFERIQGSEKEVAHNISLRELVERCSKGPSDKIHPLVGES
jgi:hypothetical protein